MSDKRANQLLSNGDHKIKVGTVGELISELQRLPQDMPLIEWDQKETEFMELSVLMHGFDDEQELTVALEREWY